MADNQSRDLNNDLRLVLYLYLFHSSEVNSLMVMMEKMKKGEVAPELKAKLMKISMELVSELQDKPVEKEKEREESGSRDRYERKSDMFLPPTYDPTGCLTNKNTLTT